MTPLFEAVVTPMGNTDYRHYIYANGRPVVVISRTTAGAVNVHSLLFDQQGSIATIVADATGTAAAKESFSAFGNRREAATWSGLPTTAELAAMNGVTRQGYTFQTVLGSMGLNHMNGRIEDAVIGRFLSADPYTSEPDLTPGWNPYAYADNSPLTYVDPTGFDCTVTTTTTPGSGSGSVGSGADGLDEALVRPSSSSTSIQCGGGGGSPSSGNGGGGGGKAPPKKPPPDDIDEIVVQAKRPCPPTDLSLSRPSYWQRVQSDANAPGQAIGGGLRRGATFLATGALSKQFFGTSAITPFQTWITGAEEVSTNVGTLSGVSRVGATVGVRLAAGLAVSAAWTGGTYVGAVIGNISLPGGPTITDGVSAFIDLEANGPAAAPATCGR
jgi:RHS repeat-associated protein